MHLKESQLYPFSKLCYFHGTLIYTLKNVWKNFEEKQTIRLRSRELLAGDHQVAQGDQLISVADLSRIDTGLG